MALVAVFTIAEFQAAFAVGLAPGSTHTRRVGQLVHGDNNGVVHAGALEIVSAPRVGVAG